MSILVGWDSNYWQIVLFTVSLGVVTAALIQFINDLTPTRFIYHACWVWFWLKRSVRVYNCLEQSSRGPEERSWSADPKSAYSELIANATGGNGRALLRLPPAQLVAQINAAAHVALENAKANFSLVAALSQPITPKKAVPSILAWLAAIFPFPTTLLQKRTNNSYVADLKLLQQSVPTDVDELVVKRYVEARARIASQIQRNLDGLQTTLVGDSSYLSEAVSQASTIGVSIYCLLSASPAGHGISTIIGILVIGISAGFAAQIFGNIISGIRKLGQ